MRSDIIYESGQATVESTVSVVALIIFLLMIVGAFNDMYLKLVTNFEGYELAFCATFKSERDCEDKSRKKLQSILPLGSEVKVEADGSMKTKKGTVKFKGVLKNEVESSGLFFIPSI